MADDVIAAIATPSGRGGIGIVRVSGPRLVTMLDALIPATLQPRRATRTEFLAGDGSAIDEGLVLFFPAPHSYTGEDVIELHGHGGVVVLQSLLQRCLDLGARVAEPGEFTKRAFLNDKLDLAQAESVADLINASTTEAARGAVRSLRGEFSQRIEAMVQALIELRMLVEATLDFPEEEVEYLAHENLGAKMERVREQLSQVMAASRRGSLLREGIQVVLAGRPNVGKSSLLNRLAGAELAIVTDIPGTTRDAIRDTIDVRGVPLHMIDTAGLREPRDAVEKIGISRTWDLIFKADLLLWVSDAMRPETETLDASLSSRLLPGVPRLRVINKIDLLPLEPQCRTLTEGAEISLSAKTGAGIELLQDAILEAVNWGGSSEGIFMARARHLLALQAAAQHLEVAMAHNGELELFAEELRLAQQALSEITGEFSADDLLGKIFSQFCIGK